MTKLKEVYKCSICGNIVEILHTGAGQLVCCGEPMDMMVSQTEGQGQEKHLSVIEETLVEKSNDKKIIKVKIGDQEHPMTAEHYIEWIEIIDSNGKIYKNFLKLDGKPEEIFCLQGKIDVVRVYCNIHGLWEMKNE